MLKLQTPVDTGRSKAGISYEDKVLVMGSCFADCTGRKMKEAGMDVLVNPFGTLYNPVSVCNALARLNDPVPFDEGDCVPMGAGAGLVCSFSHHTSFARKTPQEFLDNANRALEEASAFYRQCSKVILTMGTSWCFRHISSGEIVSNCLKRDGKEFSRERLSLSAVTALLDRLVEKNPERHFIFSVSPIRHLADGAHGNTISKAILLLAEEAVCSKDNAEYFPAFEILNDELRDYRFYAEDMVHPSAQAENHIWDLFTAFAFSDGDKEKLLEGEKLSKKLGHRPIHLA